MNQKLMRFKRYIGRLLGGNFSLTKFMEEYRNTLNFWGTSSGPRVFDVVRPYYKQLEGILGRYRRESKATRNPMRRRSLRKQAAKDFLEVVSRIHGIIPKMLLEIPRDLPDSKFDDWKTAASKKADLKVIAGIVKSCDQLEILKSELEEIFESTKIVIDNKCLKDLTSGKIKQKSLSEEDYENFQIGGPSILRGPEVK